MFDDGGTPIGVKTFSCRAQATLRRLLHVSACGAGTPPAPAPDLFPAETGTEPLMGLILLILLVMLLFGGLPRWQYSKNWGYGPSGFLGIALVVVLVLVLLGHIPRGF